MRSIAQTGKMALSPTQQRQRWVVLRHRAAAAACLTVDAAAAAAYCTPEGAAQIRPADGFLHNHCPNSRDFYKRFFLTWFSTIVDYHLCTENYFPTLCTAIRPYHIGGGFD